MKDEGEEGRGKREEGRKERLKGYVGAFDFS